MEQTKYCLCCGRDVRFSRINREGRTEQTCEFCGFVLSYEDKGIQQAISTPATRVSGYILVADDSKFTRKIILDLLTEKQLASEVMAFENGLELTSAFAKLASEKKPVDIFILDINMPVMDGFTAAKIIRTIELQNAIPNIPIVFFSTVRADDNLRNQMKILAPANYIDKAIDPDPDKLAERVERVISYILQIRKKD